jgi:tetratricopeptide (TPR) repeat protein
MRGDEGDLQEALELGDQALDLWIPGTRALDLAQHLHLHANTTCWVGQYEDSVELSRRTRSVASDVHSAESLLRGGGLQALALTGLGRHEEAIGIFDELFNVAAELGQPRQVLLNYSSLAYRDLYDLGEARTRSEEALSLSGTQTFGMPRQFAGSDLLFTRLLAGDIGGAQAIWPALWEGASKATAWTTWLIAGRLAYGRAVIALHTDAPEVAAEWAEHAIQIARRTKRRKYEARALTALGQAFARLGRRSDALQALRSAVTLTDELIGQPERWQARSAFGKVAHTLGEDDVAAAVYDEAADLVEEFAKTLAPERARGLLAAPDVAEILSLAGRRSAG